MLLRCAEHRHIEVLGKRKVGQQPENVSLLAFDFGKNVSEFGELDDLLSEGVFEGHVGEDGQDDI